jgi:leucyl aminopeptidase
MMMVPVEFHWYAAEEGGLLGSQAVARYKKESGAKIGAMLEFVSISRLSGQTMRGVNFPFRI